MLEYSILGMRSHSDVRDLESERESNCATVNYSLNTLYTVKESTNINATDVLKLGKSGIMAGT